MKSFKFTLLTCAFLIILTSCQKDENESTFNEDLIDQETEIENLLADLDAFSEEVIDSELGLLKSASLNGTDDEDSCPVITYYRNSEPRKMIIDFGNECEGRDGKLRSGKIIITSSSFENLMTTRTKTFEIFSVNGRDIDGIITKTVMLNREDKTRISEVHEDLTIASDGKIAFRKGTMNRMQEPGDLYNRSDDRISSWGEVVTVWQDNLTVTKIILEENPLVFLSACHQIVSGVLFVSAGDKSWSINYGDGNCDNQAIITRNGIERQKSLGRSK